MFQFQFHPTLPGLGVSCGEDGTSRIWKTSEKSSAVEQQQSANEEKDAEEEECKV